MIPVPISKYSVDRVIGKAQCHILTYYLIKWKGRPVEQSSWERPAALKNCASYLTQFNNLYSQQTLPFVVQEYQQKCADQIQWIKNLNYLKVKNASIQKIFAKIKIQQRSFYLVKWNGKPIQKASWVGGYYMKYIKHRLTQFNARLKVMAVRIPYFDGQYIENCLNSYQTDINQNKQLKLEYKIFPPAKNHLNIIKRENQLIKSEQDDEKINEKVVDIVEDYIQKSIQSLQKVLKSNNFALNKQKIQNYKRQVKRYAQKGIQCCLLSSVNLIEDDNQGIDNNVFEDHSVKPKQIAKFKLKKVILTKKDKIQSVKVDFSAVKVDSPVLQNEPISKNKQDKILQQQEKILEQSEQYSMSKAQQNENKFFEQSSEILLIDKEQFMKNNLKQNRQNTKLNNLQNDLRKQNDLGKEEEIKQNQEQQYSYSSRELSSQEQENICKYSSPIKQQKNKILFYSQINGEEELQNGQYPLQQTYTYFYNKLQNTLGVNKKDYYL